MTKTCPFIEGFRQAVRPILTPDRVVTLSEMPSPSNTRKLAAAYGCHERTLTRLSLRGVDITNPEAIALALASQRNVSPVMLESAIILADLQIKNAIKTSI